MCTQIDSETSEQLVVSHEMLILATVGCVFVDKGRASGECNAIGGIDSYNLHLNQRGDCHWFDVVAEEAVGGP